MPEVTIGLWGMPAWRAGDFAAIAEMAALAERKGIDRLDVPDHLLMSENLEVYPYADVPPAAARENFYEPLTILAALADRTSRIRLSTGILISPLRSAVFLAKQAATLDVISNGRLDLGIGVGWQKEEFDASGVPWEGRYAYMDEQVLACKQLWSQSPASFSGKRIAFERVYSMPLTVQAGGIPIWYGLAPTDRNFGRIAELGDGWMPSPLEHDADKLKTHIQALRAAFTARGRDPDSVKVQAKPRVIRDTNGAPDIEATLAQFDAFAAAGVTSLYMATHYLCSDKSDYEKVLERIVAHRPW